MANEKKSIKAYWIKFHPNSACSVGQTEEMPEARFKALKEKGYVVTAKEGEAKAAAPAKETATAK